MVRILVLIALFALATAKLTRIPMIKRQNHVLSVDNVRVERNYIMEKYHNTIEDDSQQCVVNLDHTIQNQFYAQVSVGTPPQVLNTVFDTSGYVAYISKNSTCSSCSTYNVDDSSSAHIIDPSGSTYIDYLDNNHFGNYTFVLDIFSIGGASANVKFAMNTFAFDNVDMLFGLSHQNEGALLPPLYYLYQQQVLDNIEYSLYYDTNNDTDFGGHLILGGVDSSVYSGTLNNMKFPNYDNAVTVTVEKFSINGVVGATNTVAYIESASNFVGVPLLTFIRINQQIDGIVDNEGNYFVECDQVDNLPNVLFTIGGVVYTMTPQSYILRVSQGLTPCMSAFTYINDETFNLGQPFLTNVYTYINIQNLTIGFANLV